MTLNLNKIIESFNKLNDQTRYAVFGGVVFLFILLDVVLLVMPQVVSIASMSSQIRKMSEDTQEVLVDRQRVGQLRKNLQQTRDQWVTLNLRVRPIQEVPGILSTISSIANDNNVKIDQLIPEKNQQETLTTTTDGKFFALPVVIRARCGYHMFGRFLNKLENEEMYFIIKDFIIQNDSPDVNMHSFSLTIKLILVDHNAGSSKKP